MLLYLLFDYVLGKFRGSFVYGFFKPDEVSITDALIIGVVFYLMMFAVGGLFLFLNKLAHKKKQRLIESVELKIQNKINNKILNLSPFS